MNINLPELILGLVMTACAVLWIIFRRPIARQNWNALPSEKINELVRKSSSPGLALAVGIGFLAISVGVVIIAFCKRLALARFVITGSADGIVICID